MNIVCCKNCKYWCGDDWYVEHNVYCYCQYWKAYSQPEDFCSRAEEVKRKKK